MAIQGIIGVVADDLTGANDTALQFFMKGANTEIIFSADSSLEKHTNVGCWSLTTETRNTKDKIEGAKKVWTNAKALKENFNIEYFYKKIDSTLRGSIAFETLAMLDAIEYDAAVIAPAFIQEGRITIGGYQLLKGVPIERTDAARDTYAPIYESHIPAILKSQLTEDYHNKVTSIELNTIAKGAGPITNAINELVANDKKLIVADAVSATDLEQIALAVSKSKYKILPVGSAGLANAMSDIWLPEKNEAQLINKQLPVLPKLILSGSKTSITTAQIEKLSLDDDIDNVYFIELHLDEILNFNTSIIANRIAQNLGKNNIVIAHVSKLDDEINSDEGKGKLIDLGITKENLANKITDYLAELAKKTNELANFALITIGGETSYKCTKAIECGYLQVVEGILPAISLCMDKNAKFVVAKSGNMGSASALIDIISWFNRHEKE